jgi:hypothetical protein
MTSPHFKWTSTDKTVGGDIMTETVKNEIPEKKEIKKESEQAWYDVLVKVVQEFLEFNMHTYKTEKAPRL